jgi:hypothetical protein
MGKTAASALARSISTTESPEGVTKAITVLAKIGKDVADDEEVGKALLARARSTAKNWDVRADNWKRLQVQLAAIDALGEINKYRGGIVDKEVSISPMPTPTQIRKGIHDLGEIVEASDNLASIAGKLFDDLAKCKLAPTPTPHPGPGKPCPDFCCNLKILHESQARMVKLAGDVNVDTSSSEKKESPFPKLADEKILGASLKNIEVGYSDATKEINDDKLTLENAYDKTSRQFKTEAAYDLLTEARQLNAQLHDLDKAVADLKKNRDQLIGLISALGDISKKAQKAERKAGGGKTDPELIQIAVANTINAIFSKPPKKKPDEETTKKGGTKKDTTKEEKSQSD